MFVRRGWFHICFYFLKYWSSFQRQENKEVMESRRQLPDEQHVPEPWKQQDEANTDTSNQIQHETSVRDSGSFSLNPPAAVQSAAADVSQALTSPCSKCFPCIFFFPPSTSCGNHICWATFPLMSQSRSHLSKQPTWQSIKTQGHKGEDRQWGAPREGPRPAGATEPSLWQRLPAQTTVWHMRNNGGCN